jgi:hypothetical protein
MNYTESVKTGRFIMSKEKEQKDYKPLHENPLETENQSCILSFRHMTHDPFNVFKFFVCTGDYCKMRTGVFMLESVIQVTCNKGTTWGQRTWSM